MILSLDWIKDYVEIPEDIELSRLAYDLTMSTVEVEGVVKLARKFDNMVVGVVNDILPHPNSDKNRICKTDLGNGNVHEIVCGGINLRKGMKVAVSLPGAMVRWHGEGDLVEVEIAKIHGVESYGMICASSEIGLFELFPFTEDATIMDLSEFEASPGTSLAAALDLDDVLLEIDNKSLTNRPDLWGHYGIAREISAMYNTSLKEFTPYTPQSVPHLEVVIEDETRCPRYIGVRIEGLSVKAAPFYVQSRIWRVGMRPINAIVDITNYVMLATGNPTHAFDADQIEGHITVRLARNEEKLLLLDDKELSLSVEDLVIADDEDSVGLAGVMGGKRDSILPTTDKVILEVANFEPTNIRRTVMRHEARTESAIRFEKGIDPERADITLSLAMQLFVDFYPELTITGFQDNYPNPLKRSEVEVSLDWMENHLGKRISNRDVMNILQRLGFKIANINPTANILRVVAPTWRSTGDITIADDIMEEIARLYGYENFEPIPIATTFEGGINQIEVDMDRKIREFLALRCGMNEIFTYPWVSDELINAIIGNNEGMLSLSAPPSPQERFLRTSLVPNLCKAVASNLRYFDEFAIFESAQVFQDRDYESRYDSLEALPFQAKNVAGAFVGSQDDVNSLFKKAKGVIESMTRCLHIEALGFAKIKKPAWADNVVWLNITCNDESIGSLALLSKKASIGYGIKNSAVMLFEMDIDALEPLSSRTNEFSHLPEFPTSEYDLSLLLDSNVKWADVQRVISNEKDSNSLIQGVPFIDEYKGKQIPDGKKSLTCRLLLGSHAKTLTSSEIESCASAIISKLKETFGAELRG